jgi:hypothetical protein
MPERLLSCKTLPHATISSVPIYDFVNNEATEELANTATEEYYECCGKSICNGCMHSFRMSGNDEKCPYCNADRMGKTDEEAVEELMKRVEVNDAGVTYILGSNFTMEEEVCSKIGRGQWNYGLGQRHWGSVWRILT